MYILNFIIAVVALIIAILAYQRSGGISDIKKQIDSMGSLREKTADLLGKLEKKFRKEETDEVSAEEKKESQ
ncbi:MAG: hypothetical protein SV062_14925 [Thermodesulfobacteriota bacterium]|nr:hypothetical protein [Thermodesulfobacteriota bacterium]